MPIEACYSAKTSSNCEPLPLLDARRSPSPSPQRESSEVRDELVVTYRKINTLTPFANNARVHSRSQIRKLRDSIQTFGFVNPVLINTAGTIVAGHGRVQAAKLLGMTEVPTICLENLTPDEIRAYVIADNRLAEDAGWDEQILKIRIERLSKEISTPQRAGDLHVTRWFYERASRALRLVRCPTAWWTQSENTSWRELFE
jgi:ParB/Sulfiredoxin domain